MTLATTRRGHHEAAYRQAAEQEKRGEEETPRDRAELDALQVQAAYLAELASPLTF